MTEINQSFTMYQGETKNLIVPITKDDGSDLDLTGATIKWTVKDREYSTNNVFEKDTPEISVSGNVLTIPLKPPDTETLSGTYFHKCEIVDQLGNDSVLLTGMLTVQP